MLRISKLSDYSIVLLSEIARQRPGEEMTARQLAEKTAIALPTVIKLLKRLKESGVLLSTQGRNGGYRLAQDSAVTHLALIIEAVEGPIALTECAADDVDCQIHERCNTRRHWNYINAAFRQALSVVTLQDLTSGVLPVKVGWIGRRQPEAATMSLPE